MTTEVNARERNAQLRLAEIRERSENWCNRGRYEAKGKLPFPAEADVANLLARIDRMQADLDEERAMNASLLETLVGMEGLHG